MYELYAVDKSSTLAVQDVIAFPQLRCHQGLTVPHRSPHPPKEEGFKRVVMCSGKVYYELAKKRADLKKEKEVAIIRLEQVRLLSLWHSIHMHAIHPSSSRNLPAVFGALLTVCCSCFSQSTYIGKGAAGRQGIACTPAPMPFPFFNDTYIEASSCRALTMAHTALNGKLFDAVSVPDRVQGNR